MSMLITGSGRRTRCRACRLLLACLVIGPVMAEAHVVSPTRIRIVGTGIAHYATLTVQDAGTCQANVSATINAFPPVATIDPPNGSGITVQFRITAEEFGSQTIEVHWVGFGTDNDGFPCTEDGFFFVPIEVVPEASEKAVGNNLAGGVSSDPVETWSGALVKRPEPDLAVTSRLPLTFQRLYASDMERAGISGTMGRNWRHSFEWDFNYSGEFVQVISPGARVLKFGWSGDAWSQTNATDVPYQLRQDGNWFYLADPTAARIMRFDGLEDRIDWLSDGKGNYLHFSYDFFEGYLTQVSNSTVPSTAASLNFLYSAGPDFRVTGVYGLYGFSSGPSVSYSYTGGNLAQYTNALGNPTTYAYDTMHAVPGLLTAWTLPEGNTPYTNMWDAEGRMASQTDALGHTTQFSLQPLMTPGTSTVTHPDMSTFTHQHDGWGSLMSYTDELGHTMTGTMDGNMRRTGITDRLGDTTSWMYHLDSGLLQFATGADGATTEYSYMPWQAAGMNLFGLTLVEYPDGSTKEFDLDTAGNVVTYTDRRGFAWGFTYDATGNPLTVTNPAGGVTTFTRTGDGRVLTAKDPANNTTTYGYDPFRRINSITRPDGTTRTFLWNLMDDLVSVTDERGETTSFGYDDNGRLETVTDPEGVTLQFGYNLLGRIVSVTDRRGNASTRAYGDRGELSSVTNRTLDTTEFHYDDRLSMTGMLDPDGHYWWRGHDAEKVVSSVMDPGGRTFSWTSDDMGRLTDWRMPSMQERIVGYDLMGRISSVTDPLGRAYAASYGPGGNLLGTSFTGPGLSLGISYTRDSLGLVTGITDANGKTWSRGYDNAGRITSRTDPLGNTIGYGYDNRGRVNSLTFPGGLGSLGFTFDGVGNVTRRLYSDGLDLTYSLSASNRILDGLGLSFTYDADDNLLTSNGITMTRDASGRLETVTLDTGKTITYGYNGRGQVTSVMDWVGGMTMFNYGPAGRLMSLTRPNGVTTSYEYNDDSQVVKVTEGGLGEIDLTRNGAAEITAGLRDRHPLDLSLRVNYSRRYQYDDASQISMPAFDYDALGRLTMDDLRSYEWDLGGRLTGYLQAGVQVDLTYDGYGQLLSRTRNGTTREYVWNYGYALPAVSIKLSNSVPSRYYVHSPGGLLLHSVDMTDNRQFYHFDEMGNTSMLTDDAGMVTREYRYSPYGLRLDDAGGGNPFTWQGQFGVMQEGRDGLYYMRARYYDARKGRFLSRDPVGGIDFRSANPYQYGGGNPRLFIDPTGFEILPMATPPVDGDRPPSLRSIGEQIAGNDPSDPGDLPPFVPTVLIITQMNDPNTDTFIRQRDHFSAGLIQRGYKVRLCDAQTISDRAIIGSDLGISQTDLRNTVGIVTIGHSSSTQVANFNESSLEELMKQTGVRGDGTGKLEFLAFWGCDSSSFYDNNRERFAPYLDEFASVWGFGTWEVGIKWTGFGNRLNPFGSDPFFDYMDQPFDTQTGGEFSAIDPLGYIFGDLLMDSLP